jgi:hypothetical protein
MITTTLEQPYENDKSIDIQASLRVSQISIGDLSANSLTVT